MKKKTKINFSIALCVVIYIVLQVVIRISDRFYTGNFNGVFSACQFAICLLMIYIDRKKGFFTASLLMICSILLLFRIVCIEHMIAPLPGLVNFLIYLLTLVIITKQIHVREQAAVTDMLTGLSNRRGIFWRVKQKTEDGQPFSVICLTLVNYKTIRDNFGNDYCEMLLKHIARRIVNVVDREGSVGMINDGEFAVVLKSGNNPEIIANEILEAVREKVSLVINGTRIESYVTPYAGVSSFPEDANNPEELIKDADLAMLHAVRKNMSVPYRFDCEIEKYMARQIRMENLIKEGLEKQYFYMVYQPQYALKDKFLRGFESLIRMKTAQGEIVSPGEFIPFAEKSELILKNR